jgi:predicted GNAT family acetyltransferase
MIKLFLPPEISLPQAKVPGELRVAGPPDMPVILEWLAIFYAETLYADLPPIPSNLTSNPAAAPSGAKLFVWAEKEPVAMGLTTNNNETCRINLIYVTPAHRRKGYGRAIVSALATRIREDSRLPVLHAASENLAAINLYTSLGFRELI